MKHILFYTLFLTFISKGLYAGTSLQLEIGLVHQTKNETRVPGDTGTTINFGDFNKSLQPYFRIEGKHNFGKKHSLRFVYAPLSIESTGSLATAVNFNNTAFSANQDITFDYTFNSYRLGYAYSLISDRDEVLQLGLTAKIRDAKVKLTQGSTSSTYENTGFVPLIYASYFSEFGDNWFIYSDIDIIVASQGRAIDFTFKIRKNFSKDIYMSLGGRTLEGGADNSKVYTQSWFNFVSIDFGAFL